MKTLVYLAVPYSHVDPDVMETRFHSVNRVAANLMKNGTHIFSPISHTHPIAKAGGLPRGWDFWGAYDRAILGSCCKLVVLMLDGWRESAGVKAEIGIAEEMGIPIEFMSEIDALVLGH